MTDGVLDRLAGLDVLVIGESFLDGWLSGPSSRLSREAPVPVVSVTSTELVPGAAANTAVNAAALGARVRLLSVVGADEDGAALTAALVDRGIAVDDVLVVPGRRTAAKRRVLAGAQMLTRVDTGDTGPLDPETTARLLFRLAARLPAVDVVVVSDYGGGVCGDELVAAVAARTGSAVLVVDSRDPARWSAVRATAVKPNAGETERLLGRPLPTDRVGAVLALAPELLAATGAELAAVTLDTDGAVLLTRSSPPVHLPAVPRPHSQAAGAGDSFTAAFALALGAGAAPSTAARLGAAAAAVAVRRPGTAVVAAEELRREVTAPRRRGLLGAPALAAAVRHDRAAGRRIVFTNGCFDVLHRGHVAFLDAARDLGDVLVVALNSDASVARLKGPDRPVNPVEDRAAVLQGLSCVDHLAVFDGDTPADLLEAVRPDVYVKGGDYTEAMLPEAPLVARLGGEVRILGYLEDRSTTGLLDRIRRGAPS